MNRTFNILPYLALICLSLAVLSGCKKVDVPSDDLSQGLVPSGIQITFETDDPASKAIINSKDDLEQVGNSFRVFSWFEGTTSGSMFREDEETDGIPVTYTAATSTTPAAWTYTPLRYWMSGTYNFAAVYPSSVAATYQPATQNGTPILSIPSFDITSQEDLMYAVKNGIDGSTANNNNPVALQFSHMLSKINIEVKQNIENDPFNEYYVSGVVINGLERIGSYAGSWVYDGTKAPISTTFRETVLLKNANQDHLGETEFMLWGESGLLVFPQTIGVEAIQVIVEFNYKLTGMDRLIPSTAKGYIPVTPEWQPGKSYSYVMYLSQETDIVFSAPTIEPWGSTQTGSSIIIQ